MSTISSTFSPVMDEIPFKLLDVNVIAAHDLPPMAKMLRTYVVARVNPDHKQKTPVDHKGHVNPSWNHKMSFRVDEKFLRSHSSNITFDIYNVAWLRDLPIGTSKLCIQNIYNNNQLSSSATKPMSLQICRPSGLFKGTLNVTVNIIDNAAESDVEDKDNSNLSTSLDEIIAEKFEPSENKEMTYAQDFKLMLDGDGDDDDDSISKKKTRKNNLRGSSKSTYSGTLKPLPSDIVAALNEPSTVDSSLNNRMSFGRSNTFDDSWTAGIDDESMEERMQMHSKMSRKCDDNQYLIDKDRANKTNTHHHHYHHNRRHSDGGGLLSCFIKGFEFTFACGGRSNTMKNNKKKMVGKGNADDFMNFM